MKVTIEDVLNGWIIEEDGPYSTHRFVTTTMLETLKRICRKFDANFSKIVKEFQEEAAAFEKLSRGE